MPVDGGSSGLVNRSNRSLWTPWRLLLFWLISVDYVQYQLYDRDDHKDELEKLVQRKLHATTSSL